MELEDRDLLARMRAADPAADLEPVSPERVTQLLEDVMEHPTQTDETPQTAHRPETARARRAWLPWLGGAAAAAVLAVAGFAVMGPGGDAPGTPPAAAPVVTWTTVGAPAATDARCMVPSAETLRTAELAVDATVTGVDGSQVTLTVDRWYAGTPTDELVVTSPPEALRQLIEAPELEVGQRYLLAANGGQLVVCGFSGPYDADRAALYAEAFGG
jgi:hypothetical protein